MIPINSIVIDNREMSPNRLLIVKELSKESGFYFCVELIRCIGENNRGAFYKEKNLKVLEDDLYGFVC